MEDPVQTPVQPTDINDDMSAKPSQNIVDSRFYAIDRAVEPLRWIFRWSSLVVLIAMVSLPFIQVVSREVFATPIVGVEELARFMLICSVFLAFPYVISSGANIRMEELVSFLPKSVLRPLRTVVLGVATVCFASLALASFIAISGNLDNSTPTLGLPYWIFFGAALSSFAMSTLECAILTFKAIKAMPLYVSFPQEIEPEEELDLPADMKH